MTTASFERATALPFPRIRMTVMRKVWPETGGFLLLFALYAVFSVRAQLTGTTHGYDLGIFTQGIRGYAEGIGPISAIKGPAFNLLGDHFSPIDILIAPFYAVFPTPITLLVAQSVLVAASAVPIIHLFSTWFGRRIAAMAGAAYGLSFGIANAVGFDFHEVAFAAPLLAFAMVAVARRRAVAAVAWAAPLVLVKEDMGFTVAAVGVVLALVTRRRALGAGLAAFGLLATFLEVKVLIPAFNPSGQYAYSGQIAGIKPALVALLSGVDIKAVTVLCLLGVTAFASLRSPLLLVVVPTLLWRFVSSNPNYWGTNFHYGLLLMPVAFVAMADGIRRLDAGRAGLPSVRWFVSVSLGVSLLLVPATPFWTLIKPSSWRPTPTAAAAQEAARMIPSGATVAAAGPIVPQLVDRTDVWMLWSQEGVPDGLARDPQWVVVDTWTNPNEFAPESSEDRAQVVEKAESRGYHQVFAKENITLLRR